MQRIVQFMLVGLTMVGIVVGVLFAQTPIVPQVLAAQPTPQPPPLPPKIPIESMQHRDSHKGANLLPIEQTERLSNKPCINGKANNLYPCLNVDLLAFMPLAEIGGGRASSSWGWTDPDTHKEYALLGRTTGTSFVDISDPTNPVYLGDLPSHTSQSWWRELKTYGYYALIVSDRNGAHGLQIFDLRQLRNVSNPPATFSASAHYAGFDNGHTITVNPDTGYAYVNGSNTCEGGLHIVDVRDPLNPAFVSCFGGDGYTHDSQCVLYHGPDAAFQGSEICFNANEDTLTLVDVTDKQNPTQIVRKRYADAGYTHQGWLTEDQQYFVVDDEYDEMLFAHTTFTYIWDVRDLDNPQLIGTHRAQLRAIDHNQYIVGDRLYQANYRAGLRVLDASDVAEGKLREVGFFDIYPADNSPEFNAAWNVYPFYASGVVTIAGIEQGLYIVRPQPEPDPPPCSHKPGMTTITRPQNNSTLNKTRVRLKWQAEPCASSYTVLLYEFTGQDNILLERVNVTKLRYRTPELEHGKMYAWRVRACNAWGCHKGSIQKFMVQ